MTWKLILLPVTLAQNSAEKSIKALIHQGTKPTRDKEELFFSLVAFVSFVVQGF